MLVGWWQDEDESSTCPSLMTTSEMSLSRALNPQLLQNSKRQIILWAMLSVIAWLLDVVEKLRKEFKRIEGEFLVIYCCCSLSWCVYVEKNAT